MIDGYARVSTSAQDLAAQRDQLEAAGCERIFCDKLGGLTKERPQLKTLLATAALGDTIIIPAIDRLSRGTADPLTIARDLKTAGVGLRSLAEPVIDTASAFSDIVLAVLGLAAKLEGVADRVSVETGDARALPFADASFDAVLSHWVVHNLPDTADRLQAIDEMLRVLRPGGVLVLAGIANHADYRTQLKLRNLKDIREYTGGLDSRIVGLFSFGSFRPQATVGRNG